MKIAIIGPGAIGCLFAAHLAKTKNEIWLLDKYKERANEINKQGISIEGISGNWRAKVKAASQAKEIGKAELIILTVKSYDTKKACTSIKSLADNNSYVLTLQNGIGNVEIISDYIDPERIITGTTSQGATLLAPGKIRHAGRAETIIGKLEARQSSGLRQVREVLNKAGIKTKVSQDIKAILWSKLIINVGINALTAITRLNNGRLIKFPGTRQILRDAVLEAVKVSKRKRIKLIYDDPIAKVETVCEATASNISSMLQDVLKKKRTEIDFINGVIVRQAKSLNIPTPVNNLLVNLVESIESSYELQLY